MGFSDNIGELIQRAINGAGSWVMLRNFTDTHSEYWNDGAQEAIGGPAYTFTDSVILASKQSAQTIARSSGSGFHEVLEFGNLNMDTYRYFFHPDVTIREDDEIYDLDAQGSTTPSVDYTNSGTGASILGRYKVKGVITYKGNQGVPLYTVAITKRYFGE